MALVSVLSLWSWAVSLHCALTRTIDVFSDSVLAFGPRKEAPESVSLHLTTPPVISEFYKSFDSPGCHPNCVICYPESSRGAYVFTPYFSQFSLCFNPPSHPGWTQPHSLDLQVPTFPPSPLTGHIPATCSSQWVSAFSLLCELFPQSARLSENHVWVRCHCLVGILSTASVNNIPILSEFASAGVWHLCGVSQCKAWAPVWLP